jgi:AI-2 transport protein TqsA
MEAAWQQLMEELKGVLIRFLKGTIGSAVGFFSTFTFMLIFVLFLLAGRKPAGVAGGAYAEVESNIRRYLATKTALSAITGILVTMILAYLGLELAIVFGVLTFILNFIPSVGSIIATLLPLPVAYAQFESGWMLLWVLLLPGSVQMLIGNVIEPRIMGEGLDLHPITILFALTFWGLLWGPMGAILAVPITAILRIAMARFQSLRPVAELMAGRLPAPG